jgi:hypothetical protein
VTATPGPPLPKIHGDRDILIIVAKLHIRAEVAVRDSSATLCVPVVTLLSDP